MWKPNGSVVFALKGWTIRFHHEKFYIAPTNGCAEKQHWSKPYRTLQAACAGIARQCAQEWRAREQRRSTFYRTKGAAR